MSNLERHRDIHAKDYSFGILCKLPSCDQARVLELMLNQLNGEAEAAGGEQAVGELRTAIQTLKCHRPTEPNIWGQVQYNGFEHADNALSQALYLASDPRITEVQGIAAIIRKAVEAVPIELVGNFVHVGGNSRNISSAIFLNSSR